MIRCNDIPKTTRRAVVEFLTGPKETVKVMNQGRGMASAKSSHVLI